GGRDHPSEASRRASDERAVRAWDEKAGAAFAPLVDATPRLVTAVREWLAGSRDDESAGAEVDRAVAAFTRARDAVEKLPTPALARRARGLYLEAALLYGEAARVDGVLLDTPAGPARNQVDLLARRVRELGDRVFDRGRVLIEPYLGEASSRDIEVHQPEEVPDWVAEGMAAGPPLERDAPPPPGAEPPQRQASRPQEPRAE